MAFVPRGGSKFTDAGSETCGGQAVPDTQPPTAPATLTAGASAGEVDVSWAASFDNIGVSGSWCPRRGRAPGRRWSRL